MKLFQSPNCPLSPSSWKEARNLETGGFKKIARPQMGTDLECTGGKHKREAIHQSTKKRNEGESSDTMANVS